MGREAVKSPSGQPPPTHTPQSRLGAVQTAETTAAPSLKTALPRFREGACALGFPRQQHCMPGSGLAWGVLPASWVST